LIYAGQQLVDDDVTLPEVGILHGACVQAATDISEAIDFLERVDPDPHGGAPNGMAHLCNAFFWF
jgi:hypothetical protein